MSPSRLCCRCLVFLPVVVGAGFLAPLAEAAATRPFADIVDDAARRHGVDADLVHAVIAVESGYRASAQSPAGAQGMGSQGPCGPGVFRPQGGRLGRPARR